MESKNQRVQSVRPVAVSGNLLCTDFMYSVPPLWLGAEGTLQFVHYELKGGREKKKEKKTYPGKSFSYQKFS